MTDTANSATAKPSVTETRLTRWVATTMVEGCQLHDCIPECWAEHPGVVQELGVLMEVSDTTTTPAEQLALLDATERVLNRIKVQYPTRKCLTERRHKVPRRWPSQPDDAGDARRATRP